MNQELNEKREFLIMTFAEYNSEHTSLKVGVDFTN